jgi:toxin ParE1/3/4
MRIIWSANAIANLLEIQEFIARDKPEAARRIAQRVLVAVKQLAKHPHLGHPGREPETRELNVGGTAYIVPYEIYRGRLFVLAVIHDAQDPEKD